MSIEIFYFSGTGNSLAVARDLAQATSAKLTSISAVANRPQVETAADSIGIVFPAYLAQRYGLPMIVENFTRRLADIKSKYLFAVCTCGGLEVMNALPTLRNLRRVIKSAGGTLSAEFSIKLPMNNLTYPFSIISQDQEHMFAVAAKTIPGIAARVVKRQGSGNRLRHALINTLMSPLYAMMGGLYVDHVRAKSQEPKDSPLDYFDLIQASDKSIQVLESCNGCGICAQVCPAANIIESGRPVFLHRCEMCLACDEWCPQRAIRHWCKTPGKDYRHPSVRLADMIGQAKPSG